MIMVAYQEMTEQNGGCQMLTYHHSCHTREELVQWLNRNPYAQRKILRILEGKELTVTAVIDPPKVNP